MFSHFNSLLNVCLIQQTSAEDPEKAIHSLPPGIVVKASGIPGAGLGAFSTQEFPARTLFGPYGGELVLNAENAHKSGYAWQVSMKHKKFVRTLFGPYGGELLHTADREFPQVRICLAGLYESHMRLISLTCFALKIYNIPKKKCVDFLIICLIHTCMYICTW